MNTGADECGVRERADHTLHPRLRAIGHHSGDANVVASGSDQQQRLETSQQGHEQGCTSAVAQGAQARDEILR